MNKDQIKQIRKAIDDWMVQTMSEGGLIPTPVYDAIHIIDAALAEPSEPVAWTESAIDEYLSGYSLCGDDGDYTPTDDEKFVIKDAIIGFMSETPETKKYPSIEDIQQAVALGWCSDRNLLKRMDSDLATDIADQVYALLNRETP